MPFALPSTTHTPRPNRMARAVRLALAPMLGMALAWPAQAASPPTDFEQYLMELINRARLDPSAEATRLGIDLNEGLAPGTITATAKQPLAFNTSLIQAARDYSELMNTLSDFQHNAGGTTGPGRAAAAGYGSWAGENISASANSAPMPISLGVSESMHNGLFIDAGVLGRGHRINLMSDSFREVGLGLFGSTTSSIFGAGFPHAVLLTEDFGNDGTSTFLTGVVYNDLVTADNFYTPGEGLGGITVGAYQAGTMNLLASTSTFASGGYTLALTLAPGTYDIRFTEADGDTFLTTAAWLGGTNVKLDAINPVFTSPVPEPASALLLVAGLGLVGRRAAQRRGAALLRR